MSLGAAFLPTAWEAGLTLETACKVCPGGISAGFLSLAITDIRPPGSAASYRGNSSEGISPLTCAPPPHPKTHRHLDGARPRSSCSLGVISQERKLDLHLQSKAKANLPMGLGIRSTRKRVLCRCGRPARQPLSACLSEVYHKVHFFLVSQEMQRLFDRSPRTPPTPQLWHKLLSMGMLGM